MIRAPSAMTSVTVNHHY